MAGGGQTAIHPEDLPELLERWGSILASGEPRESKRTCGAWMETIAGSSSVLVPYRTHPDRSSNGAERAPIFEDRKRAEDDLRAREDHYRSIADSIPA
jgi:hypothetical protein